jgi:hypothetical protein
MQPGQERSQMHCLAATDSHSAQDQPPCQQGASSVAAGSSLHAEYFGRGWWPSAGQRDRGGCHADQRDDASSDEGLGGGRAGAQAEAAEEGNASSIVSGSSEGHRGRDGAVARADGLLGDGGCSGTDSPEPTAVPLPRRGSLAPVKVRPAFTLCSRSIVTQPCLTQHLPSAVPCIPQYEGHIEAIPGPNQTATPASRCPSRRWRRPTCQRASSGRRSCGYTRKGGRCRATRQRPPSASMSACRI